MNSIFRSVVRCSLALGLAVASWSQAAAQIDPLLAIPDGVPGTPGQPVTLPTNYTANGVLCSSLGFSIDFDETKLSFDPTDADEDGVPDAITLNVPSAFFTSVSYDGTDTDSEIDVLIMDLAPPLAGLPSRTLLSITFLVNAGFSGVARVGFSSDPLASCGTTTGQGRNVTTDDGSVAVPLAVHLGAFAAEAQPGAVLLSWETASELDNQGFNLWRGYLPNSPTDRLNAALIPSQAPGGPQGFAYSWQDNSVSSGQTYWYWLEDVDVHGTTTMHGPVSVTLSEPTAVTLGKLSASTRSAGPWSRWIEALRKSLR